MAIVFGAVVTLVLPSVRLSRPRVVLWVLLGVGIAFFGYRTLEAVDPISRGQGPVVDVGTTTVAAIDLVLDGGNPYTAFIDQNGANRDPNATGFTYTGGYKYGPVMLWAYLPAVVFLGPDGYFVLNWVALVATAVAAFMLLSKSSGVLAGTGAAVLALVPGILGRELFEAGFNDMVPVALALIALVLRERDFPIAAGIALGLSVATKSVPGMIVVLPMLLMRREGRRSFGLSALAAVFLGHLPWLITSAPELIAGLVTFNLTRPVDDTSIHHWIPEILRAPLTVVALGSVLFFSARRALLARREGMAELSSLIAIALAVSFAASPVVHGNYLLWYFPFIGVAVAAQLWGNERDQAQPNS